MADQEETTLVTTTDSAAASTTDPPPTASTGLGALPDTFKNAIGDLRQMLYCKVCVRPMYEPYTVACGHTFCYSCLTQWFENARAHKTCPECRASIGRQPAPAYALREIVQLFLKTREFLAEDDDIPDHEQARQAEAKLVEKDKAEHKIFGNAFGLQTGTSQRDRRHGLVDHSDGVRRCPSCFWELEHGFCNNCDTHIDIDYYDSDEGFDYGHFRASPSGRSIPLHVAMHGVDDWSARSSESEDLSDDFGEMDDFIEDDIDGRDADDDDSDVDSLELARQRLNSTGSAYSVGSARSTPARPRVGRGTSEPTGGPRDRRGFVESSSEESSSESDTASLSSATRRHDWPLQTQDQAPQRVNFAPDPPNISSDEAEEMEMAAAAAAAAMPARRQRKRRRVVADDSDEDAHSPIAESSSTPARVMPEPSSSDHEPDHDDDDEPDLDSDQPVDPHDNAQRMAPDVTGDDSTGELGDRSESEPEPEHHARHCALHPSNLRRAQRATRGAPPVALSRFSRRGRRQVADD